MKNLLLALITALLLSLALAQTITIHTHFQDESLNWLQQETARFEAAFGVDVEIVFVPVGAIVQNMLLNAPVGQGPDLIVPVPHDQLGALAEAGVLASMDQYATAVYLGDLTAQSRLAFTFAGRLFGLPMYVEGPALYVNRDLVPEGPNSFDEFLAIAREHTTAHTFGFLQPQASDAFYFGYVWLRGFGGYVFGRDADGNLNPNDIGLSTEGAVRGAEFIQRLRHEYSLIPSGVDYSVMHGQFLNGTAAMINNGPWAAPDYLAAGINFEVMPIPGIDGGSPFSGFMGVQGIVMNEFSTNKVNAVNLAKWLIRTDAQVSLATFGGRIPASISASQRISDDPIIAGFAAALADAEPMPNIPEMARVWAPMETALSLILADPYADIGAILNDAVREIRGN
ncbi:MAG: maltose ABC transporter substrate-binding protein [Truepera sp.]|nr:maltose ABC transporter substrate-binding protein [Truepera sp.]